MTTAVIPAVPELRTLAEIESAALKLDAAERSELVRLVAGTIEGVGEQEGEPGDDDRLWLAEIERRVNEIRQGKVVGRDGETVMREALARFS